MISVDLKEAHKRIGAIYTFWITRRQTRGEEGNNYMMDENFQPAGVLGDQEDSDLECMDFGDIDKPQKARVIQNFPQYVPKHTGGFGVPEKRKSNGKEDSDGGRASKARQRKKRANALPSDAMTNDNFRVACSRGNLEELRKHLVNGIICTCVCV